MIEPPKIPTRITTTPWNVLLSRFRTMADLTRFGLCRATAHTVQPTAIRLYEEGKRAPNIERFVELIEACGGIVIVRRGVTEYHVTFAKPDEEPTP
jgi:hypothetical protein